MCLLTNYFLATFKLIDTYLGTIYCEGRHLADDEILSGLFKFLKNSMSSGSSQIHVMACNNLIALEKIRQFD